MESCVEDNNVGCVELENAVGDATGQIYEKYNGILNHEKTVYNQKCTIIPDLWRQIAFRHINHKLGDIVDLMEWAKLHTLDIILDGQWNYNKEKFEADLLRQLAVCEQKLTKIHDQFNFHIKGLIKVVHQPWDNETLRNILRDPSKDSLTEEDIALFAGESGYATSMRIKKLVDAQCEDFAINLCACYLKCLKLFEEGKATLVVTEEQKKYAFDIFIALLYRGKKMDKIFELLRSLTDMEAMEFVHRFSKKITTNCKVWKTSYKVTFLSSMVFLDRHANMVKTEDRNTIVQILESWLGIIDNEEDVNESVCALKNILLQRSCTALFIYTVIESIKFMKRFSSLARLKNLKVELYIRALTKDINYLEMQRTLKDEQSIKEASNSVANGLLKLAGELDDHLVVARECILSAFSVNPTPQTFKLIENMARRCGYKVLDTGQWDCKFHAPVNEDDELAIECHLCKRFMLPITLKAFNTNTSLSEALTVQNTGLPQELCDDLVIVLCSPRYQLLSWLQEWLHLHRLCIMYLENPETTKNYITELKFVQIDFSLYQHIKREPIDEENLGYDKVWGDSEPEFYDEIEALAKKRRARRKKIQDSSEDEDVAPPPTAKSSDPQVLKTLRNFRKTSKRKADTMIVDSPVKLKAKDEDISRSALVQMLHYNCRDPPSLIRTNKPNILSNYSSIYQPALKPYPPLPSTSSNLREEQNRGNQNSSQTKHPNSRSESSEPALNLTMDRMQGLPKKLFKPTILVNKPKVICIKNPELSPVHPPVTVPRDSAVHPVRVLFSFLPDVPINHPPPPPPPDVPVNHPQPGPTLDPAPGLAPVPAPDHLAYVPEIGSEEVVAGVSSIDFDPFQEIDRLLTENTDTNCELIPDVILAEPFAEEIVDGFVSQTEKPNVMEKEEEVSRKARKKKDKARRKHKSKRPTSQLEYLLTKPKLAKKQNIIALQDFENFEDMQGYLELAAKNNYTPRESMAKFIQKPVQDDIIAAARRNEPFPEALSMPSLEEDDAEEWKEIKEVKMERSPKILTSDNSLIEQRSHEVKLEVREQTNQEKSLFREKSAESVFVEEAAKMTKKIHRDSKENKENSGYIAKRRPSSKPKSKVKTGKSAHSSSKSKRSDENAIDISQYNLKNVSVVIERLKLPEGKTRFVLPDDLEHWKSGGKRSKKKKDHRRSRDNDKKPLTDKNPRVARIDDMLKINATGHSKDKHWKINMNPKVILHRLDINKYYAKNVLANVPGMKDTELIQPQPVRNVVQVVQTTGRANNSSMSTQTSTQVTPHIQRIGQPRIDKPENSDNAASTTATNAKPSTTQSSLINILSHNVIRQPGQVATGRPVVNILSHQILRPANVTAPSVVATRPTMTTATPSTTTVNTRPSNLFAHLAGQSNNNSTRVSGEPQIINQLATPRSATGTAIKVAAASESSRIVQFICQSSDGKLIPVSSFTQNCVVKVASSNQSPNSPSLEENFTKVVQTKKPAESNVNSENSETLPKFQQAFGKSVYQNKSHASNSTNTTNHVDAEKPKVAVVQKTVVTTTTTTTSVKPIPGGVIYTRQVQSGQTINLIPQTRGQVFRIATSSSDQISVVKDTIIQNKMSALLAAALSKKDSDDSESEKADTETTSSVSTTPTTRVAIARPVQSARIVKPVLQIPGNAIRNAAPTNLSSTTLEQLREFDMVYKQVKERSSTTPASETSSNAESPESQCISVTYLNQGQKINCAPIVVVSSYSAIQPVSSPALSVVSQGNTSPRVTPSPSQTSVLPKVTPKTSKGKTVKTPTVANASKASPIPKPQQKPQEDEHTTQRIFDILAEYAEQLRNSPDLNNKPAPRRRSNPPTNPSQNSKRKKSSGSKKPAQGGSSLSTEPDTEDPRTLGSEDSSCGVMQLSVPDDDQPTTLASTSESNDSTCAPRQQLILTDSSNQPRNLIIAESSVGEALKMPNTAVLVPGNYIMPVSMVKGGQQIAVVSGGSKILATVPARSGPNMLLFQSFLNQTRKTSVPTVKYSTIQPISGISSQSLAGVTAQPPVILPPLSHGISTVTLGQPITVKKLDNCGQVNTELLLTISQSRETDSAPEDTPQPDSSTNIVSANIETVEIEEATTLSDNSSEKSFTTYQKPLIATPIATPVIAQTNTVNAIAITKTEGNEEPTQTTPQTTVMTLNINPVEQKGEPRKTEERIQTVLVTASSSNGPMMTHSRSNFKDAQRTTTATTISQPSKDEFLRNNEKKTNPNNVYAAQGKTKKAQATQRLDRELQQLCLQRKQAALERELRLQKSLSEECEDLGVDEPSTSDLFPEAELLFDSNHSPSYEQSDVTKRIIVQHEGGGKEGAKLTLFSDDDFLFEADYRHDDGRSRLNGQSEDATLLQTCTSMSDVTLNSPISPDTFRPTTPPPLHKYVHKYSNRKKSDKPVKQADSWTGEVSSSEDTTCSSELIKSTSPEICLGKITEEELADGNFKVVRVAIAKRECGDCSEEGDCSLSGRGARRSVKKLCSCCNGAPPDSRKRPAPSPQHAPIPQKKVFQVKKR